MITTTGQPVATGARANLAGPRMPDLSNRRDGRRDMERKRSAYSQKLLDPQWQRMRLEVLDRDGWACRSCGDTDKTLHAHHTFYVYGADPWDYNPGTIITLCEECHEGEHANWDCDGIKEAMSRNGFWSVYQRSYLSGALNGKLGSRALSDAEAEDLTRLIEAFCVSARGDGKAAGEMMYATVGVPSMLPGRC